MVCGLFSCSTFIVSFSVLILFVGWHEGKPGVKKEQLQIFQRFAFWGDRFLLGSTLENYAIEIGTDWWYLSPTSPFWSCDKRRSFSRRLSVHWCLRCIGSGGGRSGTVGGGLPDHSFWFLLKRSIPKLDPYSKDIIQWESLICYRYWWTAVKHNMTLNW